MTNKASAWKGDWRSRIPDRLKQWGYSGLLHYLRENPGKSYLALAEDIGDDVAAMQIMAMTFKEARAAGQLRWAAMDCLVRETREIFQNGWGRVYEVLDNPLYDDEDRARIAARSEEETLVFQKAHLFGSWCSNILHVPANIDAILDAVWGAFGRLSPPVGWMPEGPGDPFIVAAFDEGWPVEAVIEYVPVGPHALCPKCGTDLSDPSETDLEQTCRQCGTKFPLWAFE